MKKNLILLLCLLSLSTYGQKVNGIPLSDIKVKYVTVTPMPYFNLSTRLWISFDYGQEGRSDERILKNEEGNKFNFNSIAAILNFLDENGYDLVSALPPNGITVNSYLLKKRGVEKEKAKE